MTELGRERRRLTNMRRLLVRALTLVFLGAALVVTGGPTTASACSCASPKPVDVIADADVVFTGTMVDGPGDDEWAPIWMFDVDGVVKGEVERTEVVLGEDFAVGCGPNFGSLPGSIAVFASTEGSSLRAISCGPIISRASFEADLAAAHATAVPQGSGPPALVVAGRNGLTNLSVLDASGALLAATELGVEPIIAAHCPGTTRVATWSDGESGSSGTAPTKNIISIIDLESWDVIDQRSIQSGWVGVQDRIVCVDGGDRVVISRGFGPDNGLVTVSVSSADGTADAELDDRATSRGLIHPSGNVVMAPSGAGAPMETLSSDALVPIASVDLPPLTAATNGAFSTDGSRLALLVTVDGSAMEYDDNATHVMLFDVVDGAVAGPAGPPIELAGGDQGSGGRAKWIAWLDADTWLIERETDDSKVFDVVSADGALLNTHDVGWGWGLTSLDGSIVRSRQGGIEAVDSRGVSTPLTPPPSSTYVDGWLDTSRIIDAPAFDIPSTPTPAAITIRPMTEAPTTSRLEIDPNTSASATTTPGRGETERVADSPTEPASSNSDRLPWPVVVIGGLVVLAGLVAVRKEFVNWRIRRAQHNQPR